MSSTQNPHDVFVRGIFQQSTYIVELLTLFLPKPILEILDIQNIKLEDTSFVNETLKELYSDLLFQLPTKTEEKMSNIYILFEHKSSKEHDILIQLLKYQTEIYSRTKGLNPVLCLVFYHSEEGWNIPRRFTEKQKLGEKLNGLKEYVLDFEYLLFDVERLRIEEWKLSVELKVILSLLKEVRKSDFNEERFKEIIKIGREVFLARDGLDLLKRVLMYVYSTTDMDNQKVKEILDESLTEDKTEEVMTTAERLRLEGEERGKLEGKIETAFNLLNMNIPEEVVLKATGLSKEDLEGGQKKNGIRTIFFKKAKENHKTILRTAIEMYRAGLSLDEISNATKLDTMWLGRFLDRVR